MSSSEGTVKQRIVGALILVALIVAIIPAVFNGPEEKAPRQSFIPPKPERDDLKQVWVDVQKGVEVKPPEIKSLPVPDNKPVVTENKSKPTEVTQNAVEPRTTEKVVPIVKPIASSERKEKETVSSSKAIEPPKDAAKNNKAVAKAKDKEADKVNSVETKPTRPETSTVEKPTTPVTKPSVKPSFQQHVWVTQLGTFTDTKNAAALISKLKAAGYKAYSRSYSTPQNPQKTITKVYIGPDSDQAAAEARLEKLRQISGIRGIITEFQPSVH